MRDCGELLLSMGITPNLRGFDYIQAAVEILVKCPAEKYQNIYEYIALRDGVAKAAVERGIRHAIGKADRDSEWWRENIKHSATTNSEFLSIMAYRMRGTKDD